MSRNCPNCGAPIEGVKCPYCKTLLLDFADIDVDKPAYVRIKVQGQIILVKARIDNLTFTQECDDDLLYADNFPAFILRRDPTTHIGLQMTAIRDETGMLMTIKEVE